MSTCQIINGCLPGYMRTLSEIVLLFKKSLMVMTCNRSARKTAHTLSDDCSTHSVADRNKRSINTIRDDLANSRKRGGGVCVEGTRAHYVAVHVHVLWSTCRCAPTHTCVEVRARVVVFPYSEFSPWKANLAATRMVRKKHTVAQGGLGWL